MPKLLSLADLGIRESGIGKQESGEMREDAKKTGPPCERPGGISEWSFETYVVTRA
jgi:hypothetical protein